MELAEWIRENMPIVDLRYYASDNPAEPMLILQGRTGNIRHVRYNREAELTFSVLLHEYGFVRLEE